VSAWRLRALAAIFAACLLSSCGQSSSLPAEDEFERWLAAEDGRAAVYSRFEALLEREGVGDVVQAHELWRTDRLVVRCVTTPFSAPPEEKWPRIVPALRFIRDHVRPAVGEVEVVSAYRDPAFNDCVGGAPASAHRQFYALDMLPRDRRIDRDELIRRLCPIHADAGRRGGIGLGIYRARRFHIDARSYRGWGDDHRGGTFPCASRSSAPT
jgi:hypothetical protein